MKLLEKRIDTYVHYLDNDQPYLVECTIRQIVKEGKIAHVVVYVMEAENETSKGGSESGDSGHQPS